MTPQQQAALERVREQAAVAATMQHAGFFIETQDAYLLLATLATRAGESDAVPVAWLYECNGEKVASHERWLGYGEPLLGWAETPLGPLYARPTPAPASAECPYNDPLVRKEWNARLSDPAPASEVEK